MGEPRGALEGLGLTVFGDIYRGRRILVTGHTGFKGSWLALWLSALGARVTGLALDPDGDSNHWDLLRLEASDVRADIRDYAAVLETMREAQPEIVFHLAAQPLVRRSYADPLANWATNVMGSAHVLEAARSVAGVRAIVAVTTDKVYNNREWQWGYRENDALGGHDPYSASKAACETLIDSYRKAFFSAPGSPLLASARAGNVVGGGDWAEDRLVPDLMRAVRGGRALVIRSPQATRPWQHVLDCVAGYLVLGAKLLEGSAVHADAWNFGPGTDGNRTVSDVLTELRKHWPELEWQQSAERHPHEATALYLDTAKARRELDWAPVWPFERALEATSHWYRVLARDGAPISRLQLQQYVDDARSAGAVWARN